jgi:hypothetical protein
MELPGGLALNSPELSMCDASRNGKKLIREGIPAVLDEYPESGASCNPLAFALDWSTVDEVAGAWIAVGHANNSRYDRLISIIPRGDIERPSGGRSEALSAFFPSYTLRIASRPPSTSTEISALCKVS